MKNYKYFCHRPDMYVMAVFIKWLPYKIWIADNIENVKKQNYL